MTIYTEDFPPFDFIKNSGTIENFERNFAPYPVPDLIKQVLTFEQEVGVAHTRAFHLADSEPYDHSEYFGDDASRLIDFANCEGSQDMYSLWNQHNDQNPENWPVVLFGSEGGTCCVARNLAEFFVITLKDLPMYGSILNWPDDADHPVFGSRDDEEQEPLPLLDKFRDYLASIGLNVNQDPDELLQAAKDEINPAFFAWQQPHMDAYISEQ